MSAEKKEMVPVTRDYTVNLHKACHKVAFKRKAPRAMDVIRKFAQKAMGTEKVVIDTTVNHYVWNKGIRNIPRRIRVRLARKVDGEGEDEKTFYTLVQVVDVPHFHGLQTKVVEE
ncbi:60S ribosomal protein L31 [Blastocystis sp. subtype 4]|uniref:60S ribosomal protein L31 n=1 Tax=Blastocystis sp. subtype 4 TaxID=944170 RepID=UPI000711B34F|nr:60S ribosomal protein L31 [Blastocystis sp. subtype 4]KNB44922.1 60S ribosomal protein L31 [Blastocystis sp. subtype 4]|eukprot:XP_014528365.1 60S ribosomal protein L31 [Blastocystis sp. subtype 4]